MTDEEICGTQFLGEQVSLIKKDWFKDKSFEDLMGTLRGSFPQFSTEEISAQALKLGKLLVGVNWGMCALVSISMAAVALNHMYYEDPADKVSIH